MITTRPCLECGVTMTVHPLGQHRRYCDRRCKHRAQARRRRPESRPIPHCVVCDTRLKLSHPARRYCSNRCAYRAAKQRITGKPVVPRTECMQCGAPMAGIVSKQFCSNRCRLASQRAAKRGRRLCKDCRTPLRAGANASERLCQPCRDTRPPRKSRRKPPPPPDLGGFAGSEAAAIAAFLATKGVTRIENGDWPDTAREEVRTWKGRRKRAA